MHQSSMWHRLSLFQSTPPRRRRLAIIWAVIALSISIHASAKEATRYHISNACSLDFNPRLREGGDASAKEATGMDESVRKNKGISIHASAKEATKNIFALFLRKPLFQSTPPRRRRRQHISGHKPHFPISIHASAKEATRRKKNCMVHF